VKQTNLIAADSANQLRPIDAEGEPIGMHLDAVDELLQQVLSVDWMSGQKVLAEPSRRRRNGPKR
jgi:hypothetical protein